MTALSSSDMMRLLDAIGEEEERTGCQPWSRYVHPRKGPSFEFGGRNVSARLLLRQLYRGEVPKGSRVVTTCGRQDCMNLDHMDVTDIRYHYRKDKT